MIINAINKILSKINLNKDINTISEEFKATPVITPTPAPTPLVFGNNIIPGITGAPVPQSSAGANMGHVHQPPPGPHSNSWNSIGGDLFSYRRERAISETKATTFCDMLDKKIATLILARLKCTEPGEKQALSISIETLEMTRELVKEVFIEQKKDR